MATTIDEAVTLCADVHFLKKLKTVMGLLAHEVLREQAAVPFHLERTRWALRSLRRPDEEAEAMCIVMALVPNIDGATNDMALIAAVRAKINTFAGATRQVADPKDGVTRELVVIEEDHDDNPNTPLVVKKRTFRNLFGLLR